MKMFSNLKQKIKNNPVVLALLLILTIVIVYRVQKAIQLEKFSQKNSSKKNLASFKLSPGDLESKVLMSGHLSIPKKALPENFTSQGDQDKIALEIGKQILAGKATFSAKINPQGKIGKSAIKKYA